MPKVERDVVVQSPADTVYQVWRNIENMPQLMSNIERVDELTGNRSHWIAKGPLGQDAQWDAEITADEPGRLIAWRSLEGPDSPVRTEGRVQFVSIGDATRVHVALEYEAPGGTLGDIVTKIFANPEKQVEEDLQRFKERMEDVAGYDRSTEKIVGHNTEPEESERVRERYPADTYAPADAAPAQDGGVVGTYSQTVGRRRKKGKVTETPSGAGMAHEAAPGRPTTTGTPGGTLGAPTEDELKGDPEAPSERTDPRPFDHA
jgi:uncharacterized membrane protein